jgi:hypothetical protein
VPKFIHSHIKLSVAIVIGLTNWHLFLSYRGTFESLKVEGRVHVGMNSYQSVPEPTWQFTAEAEQESRK